MPFIGPDGKYPFIVLSTLGGTEVDRQPGTHPMAEGGGGQQCHLMYT